jgi:ubiquinone/menaquinone biosynthesis C-methylase UbiE
MNQQQVDSNEQAAANAFSRQAAVFDAYDDGNTIIRYKRGRVRQTVMQCLASSPTASILELNAGTGVDAIYFAGQGYSVHATDIAPGMLMELDKKVKALDLEARITHELCSYTQLQDLKKKGPYDLIFSNFAGLNCTNELDKVLRSFTGLLKPGGYAVLVILPSFCLWETLLLFRGKFKTAFRRWFTRTTGALSRVEGEYFRCWYYPPSYIARTLGDGFERKGLEGLCTLVPPSYIEGFAEKHPAVYRFLQKKENQWKANWPWRAIGDYYIITMQRKIID